MDWQQIMTFAAATTLMVISPGPNGVLVAKTAASAGRGAGFATIAGFFFAFYLHGALSIAGVSVILVQSAAAFMVLKYAGAAYLIWIGIKSMRAAIWVQGRIIASEPVPRLRLPLHRAALAGFVTNALNPKVSLFYLAAFPQFVGGAVHPWAAGALLVSLHAAINILWFGALVLVITSGARRIAHPPPWARRALNGVSGLFFVGFGAALTRLKA